MGLPDIKNTIKDGAMVVQGADAALGDAPLRDLVVSALSIAKTTVKCIALEGSVAGTVSAVTVGAGNQGSGNVSVSGNPRNEYDVRVDIVSGGSLNEAVAKPYGFAYAVLQNAKRFVKLPS